jgi:hypothetical protein
MLGCFGATECGPRSTLLVDEVVALASAGSSGGSGVVEAWRSVTQGISV